MSYPWEAPCLESALEALKADFRWFVSVRLRKIDGVHLNQINLGPAFYRPLPGLSSRCVTTNSGTAKYCLIGSKERAAVGFLYAQKWTIVSVHPEVRKLADSDDEHFTGYKGLLMSLEYPRDYYGVIGSYGDPLRLVCPGDWVMTRSDGRCVSMSEKWAREHCPDFTF